MFLLRDLPTDKELDILSERYKNMAPVATKACLILMRIGSDISQAFETLLVKDGLSMGRFLCLMILNRHPEQALNPSEMAENVGVTRPTMTGLLEGLEKDMLIKRYSVMDDRRKFSIKITPKGRKCMDRILPKYYRLISELMSNLNVSDQKHITSLLTKAFPNIY